MIVAELIDRLKQFPQGADVIVEDSNFGEVAVDSVNVKHEGLMRVFLGVKPCESSKALMTKLAKFHDEEADWATIADSMKDKWIEGIYCGDPVFICPSCDYFEEITEGYKLRHKCPKCGKQLGNPYPDSKLSFIEKED